MGSSFTGRSVYALAQYQWKVCAVFATIAADHSYTIGSQI